MRKSNYKYVDLRTKGYVRKTISAKDFMVLIPTRKIKCYQFIECFVKDTDIVIHYRTRLWAKIVATLLFPFTILFHGLGNLGAATGELSRLWFERESGSFSADHIWQNRKPEFFEDFLKKLR